MTITFFILFLFSVIPSTADDTRQRFQLYEGRLLSNGSNKTNPFSYWCYVIVKGPANSRYPELNVNLFYDGNMTFAFRFTPDVLGSWVWNSHCASDKSLDQKSGTVQCVTGGTSHGGIIGDPKFPSQFRHEDGSPYMLIGYEADWLWALELEPDTDTPTLDDFLDHVASFGFNHFLISIYSNFSVWNADLPDRVAPKVGPTLITPWVSMTDQSYLDLRFFQHWDTVLRKMEQRGLIAHLMLYVGNKNVQWPQRESNSDHYYWRYVLARFGAFSNIVLDVSKEAASYGIGNDYIHSRLKAIHKMNAHKRLVTAHSGLKWTNKCENCNLTMITLQQHFDNHADGQWYEHILKQRQDHPNIPVANLEYMYEAAPVRNCNGSCCHDCTTSDQDKSVMRMVMWDFYMAGGSGAWYDCDTSWDVISIDDTPIGYTYVKHLVDFWSQVGYYSMQPRDDLLTLENEVFGHCLADDSEYVVHIRANKSFQLKFIDTSFIVKNQTSKMFGGKWFDPTNGNTIPLTPFNETQNDFTPPASFKEDVVLHLLRQS